MGARRSGARTASSPPVAFSRKSIRAPSSQRALAGSMRIAKSVQASTMSSSPQNASSHSPEGVPPLWTSTRMSRPPPCCWIRRWRYRRAPSPMSIMPAIRFAVPNQHHSSLDCTRIQATVVRPRLILQSRATIAHPTTFQESAMDIASLASQHCRPRKGREHALDAPRVRELLAALPGWETAADGKSIVKTFRFANFYETLGFVNAIGWMANRQDHHPDLEVGYNRCVVRWSTHDVGRLSMNDFICAAKVETIASG